MGLFSKDIATFEDLFLHQLQDVYYAENQITKALPRMIEKATDPALKAGFQTHLQETEGQIARLEQVFDSVGEQPTSSPRARPARRSRASSRKPTKSPATSPTRRCSMPL